MGVLVGVVLLVVLLALGGLAAAGWFFAPRLLEMAGLGTPPAAETVPAQGEPTATATSPASAESTPPTTAPAESTPPTTAPAEAEAASGAASTTASAEDSTPAVGQESAVTQAAPESTVPATPAPASAEDVARPVAKAAGQRAARSAAPSAAKTGPATTTAARVPEERAAPRAKLRPETVDTLTGHRGQAGYGSTDPGSLAAENRVHWVLERYASALQRHDVATLRTCRSSLNAEESKLLSARGVRVWLEGIDVRLNGQSATARCTRTIETMPGAGTPVREQRAVTFTLARSPAGWIITNIR